MARPQTKNPKYKNPKFIRLNKFIAMSGVASRRHADELIAEGAVRINGKTVTDLGTKIHIDTDQVFVRNKPVRPLQDMVYVAFNKPTHVVTTMSDPEGRPSLADFFAKARVRLFPVGRLDWDSEGLLLLTNDGAFAQKVSHPKHGVAKTYLAKLSGQPTEEQLKRLTRGVSIIGGRVSALHIERWHSESSKGARSGRGDGGAAQYGGSQGSGTSAGRRGGHRGSGKYDWVKIIINEGRNRQIRQMFEKIGYDVKKLQRVGIGALRLGSLEHGKFRILSPDDLEKVFRLPKELRREK